MKLTSSSSRLQIDDRTGFLTQLALAEPDITFQSGGANGLFELALPLEDYATHRLRLDGSQKLPTITQRGHQITMVYPALISDQGEYAVEATLRISSLQDGSYSLQLTLVNRTPYTIPQVSFPDLDGLAPTGAAEDETLWMGKGRLKPYVEMTVPDGQVSFYDLHRKRYYGYQGFNLCMKWCDLGNSQQGLTLFSKDLGPDMQGLHVEKAAEVDRLRLTWVHYPYIEPGETWISSEFVIYPHRENWLEGARLYKAFIAPVLPPARPSKYLVDTMGVQTYWFPTETFDKELGLRYRDLPKLAEDALKHGVREISLWSWTNCYFEFPYRLNPLLGTEEELMEAVARCREMGVNLAPFVSVRGIRPWTGPEDWFEQDPQGYRRFQSWTYSRNFMPPFNPLYNESMVSAMACPASRGWGEAYVEGMRQLARWGFSSLGFDQIFPNSCFNKDHDHKPQQTGREFHRYLREAIAEGEKVDPDSTFSGEFSTEVTQTFQQYNWDWYSGGSGWPVEVFMPWRYVFPRFHLCMLVDRSLRWLLEAFTHGLSINFLPEAGHGLIGDDAEFSAKVQQLAAARRRYSRFFEAGEYYGSALLEGQYPVAALYEHQSEFLLILTNSRAEAKKVDVRLLLERVAPGRDCSQLTIYDIKGRPRRARQANGDGLTLQLKLAGYEMLFCLMQAPGSERRTS